MEGVVHNFCNTLEQCVNNDKSEINAERLIKKVKNIFQDDIGTSTRDYVISNILEESNGLLTFINKICERRDWNRALSEGLELLIEFSKSSFENIKPYLLKIVKTCNSVVFSTAFANEKCKALQVLCIILENGSIIGFDDEIKNIYERYYTYVKNSLKTSSKKVLRNAFQVLGIITKTYPLVAKNNLEIIKICLLNLNNELGEADNKRDKNIVSGCFQALSDIFSVYSFNPEENVDICQQLYSIFKQLIDAKASFDLRDALKFVTKHINIFIKYMYNDNPIAWQMKFLRWLLTSGENRKVGYMVLQAFYTELANILKVQNDVQDKQIFQSFYQYFLNTMKNENSEIAEVRLAIRGFGTFSEPCKIHMKKEDLLQMFLIIINRIEKDYLVNEEPSNEQLEFLPDYILCFSTILYQIGDFSFDQIISLQQISILMIRTFPRLSSIFHFAVFDSLSLTMCYLYQFKPEFLESYLQRVINLGIIWSCSHSIASDVELEGKKLITYKSYLPLWKNLLMVNTNTLYNKYEISLEIRKNVLRKLYDELLKTLLMLINKLNLNTKPKEPEDIPVTDPETGYEAEKPDDFVIFINLIDLYVELLSSSDQFLFKKWVKMFATQVIGKSGNNPMVSGFYKLLGICLQICDKINYFAEEQLKKEDRRNLYQVICKFLEGVLGKVQEFKGDLQLSCLQLLLVVPISFIKPLLPFMTAIFQVVFTVGRGYLKLAEAGVDTLDRWYKSIPADDLKPLLKSVLPYLDPFLRSKGFSGDPDIKIPLLQGRNTKNQTKKKIYIESETELLSLQRKILTFVGQLNAEMCMFMVENRAKIESVTWNKQPYLKFTIPYSDVKPNIYLDKLIPRVIELALTSGDQKTRVTSCELLHAIVIFMVGKSRQMPPNEAKQLSKLFEKISLPLIQLGCDTNHVVRQLFNPLVFQLVHWYSSPLQLKSPETFILINTLMEGISHPTDTAVRDLSGKCIKEFMIWSIKQYQQEDLENFPDNIKLIVRKICSFCSHPNSFKRLGAALAFNNLYVQLREEEAMVDIFWLELLYSLLINLSLNEQKHLKYKNTSGVNLAIKHIERVIREKNILFNRFSTKRRIPSAIKENLLSDVVTWILYQTGSINSEYRRKCLELFNSLAPFVENCSSTRDFVVKFVENSDKKWHLNIYEANGIKKTPTLEFWDKNGTIDVVLKWMQHLLCCLEAYIVLLNSRTVDYCHLVAESKIYISMEYFIQSLSSFKLQNVIKLFRQYDKDLIISPSEIEEFNELKCALVIAILDFLHVVIEQNSDSFCFVRNHLSKFICLSIFEPSILGFDLTLKENLDILSNKMVKLLNKLNEKLPEEYFTDLCNDLSEYFDDKFDKNISLNVTNISLTQRQLLKGRLLIEESEIKEKLSDKSDFSDVIRKMFGEIVRESGDKKIGVYFNNTIFEYAEIKLKLALKLTDQTSILSDCLTNNLLILHPETYTSLTYGDYFLNLFKDVIYEYMLCNFEVIRHICVKWKDFSDNSSLLIIINLLNYIFDNKQFKKSHNIPQLVANIVLNCEHFFDHEQELSMKNRNFQIEFMTHVSRIENIGHYISGERYEFLKKWFIKQLQYDPSNKTPKNILLFKTNVLAFLHCVTGPDEDTNTNLQSALDSFHKNIIHIISTNPNELDNSDLLVLFKKLLDYLQYSRSRIVLQFVANIFLTLKYNENDFEIDTSLQLYLFKIKPHHQYKSIRIIYSICCNETYNFTSRYQLAKVILMVLLRHCYYSAFEDFFIENIKKVIETLKIKLENQENVENISNFLVNKSIHFMLTEVLFSRIKISGFTDKTCPITKQAFDRKIATGKELLRELAGITKLVRKENENFENPNIKELYRLYHCNAFNAYVSLISNSKKSPDDIDIYCYLFNEEKSKGENIWKNIIDCTKKIPVPQNFDILPSRKKIFVNIRNENRKTEAKIKYLESQNLFNSTLSEDICKFDFTNTLVRTLNLENSVSSSTESDSLREIFIESVDINNHECMGTICGLIRHLVENGISPLPKNDEEAILPNWMIIIKKLMMDADTELNVKIFFARVIYNEQTIFKCYAKDFFEPIAKFIVDKCAEDNINYFVADLVEMLIRWSDNLPEAEIKLPASKITAFLMQNAHSDRQDMLKHNLEIIKTVVEVWKNIIEVPKDLLFEKIYKKGPQNLTGVQLVGIVLANDILPWTVENYLPFTKAIVAIMRNDTKKILSKPSAEVLGMILQKKSSDDEPQEFLSLKQNIEDTLNNFNDAKFLHCLEQIQIHYPKIIDRYIEKINLKMFSFGKSESVLQAICLKNILRRFEYNDCRILSAKDFIYLLCENDRDVSLLTLQIINEYIKHSTIKNIKTVIESVCNYKMDPNSIIRCAVYEVLISLYKKRIGKTDEESLELLKTCKSILLTGLVDSDLELQEKIQNFWCNEEYLSLKLSERYVKSLTDLYSPDTELFYLGYVNYFFLEASKTTPEYNKLMFEHNLSDCKFEEYKLRINWRAQQASMAPMFANTLSSQLNRLDNAIPQLIGLRETHSALDFVPTQSTLNLSSSLNPTSSFLFDLSSTSRLVPTKENNSQISDDSKKNSRRFLKDKSKISASFAKYEVEKSKKREELRRDRVKQKEANVVMYRKYRKGDLPDIQIPNSSIICPLQALARRDAVIARQLYVMLFNGLISEMENSSDFIINFNTAINTIFNQTTMFVPNVIGAFLDISLENNTKKNAEKIYIEPNMLSSLCRNSGLLPIGCLLLENYIYSSEEMPSSSKKGTATSSDSVNRWVKLADMYKELNEWDAVTGIFSSSSCMDDSNLSSQILEAIQAEANGDWRNALSHYQDLIKVDTCFDRKDFYFESFFKCYANLSDWESVSDYIANENGLETIWDGNWNQEKLFPWFMTSEVCITLQNNRKSKILQCLKDWMTDKEKADYLKDKFSEELAILSLLQNDINASKHYVQNCYSRFLEDWSHINPLFAKTRSNRLLNFQKIVDVNKYLLLNNNATDLLSYFEKNSDLRSHSITISEVRTVYRQQLLTSFAQKLFSLNDMETEDVDFRETLSKLKFTSDLNLITDSLDRNNYFVARKYCRKNAIYMESKQISDEGLNLTIAFTKVALLMADITTDRIEKFNKVIQSWGHLDSVSKKVSNPNIELQINAAQQIFSITQNIFNILKDIENFTQKLQTKLSLLMKVRSVEGPTDVQNFGLKNLQRAIEAGEKDLSNSQNTKLTQTLIDAYTTLILFVQNDESGAYNSDKIKLVLRAMKLGSREARQLFPCILQIPELGTTLVEQFKEECSNVPTWMFISWVPQLLASLDSANIKAIADIVLRIALSYPQAIMYSYRLSRENFNLNNASDDLMILIAKLDKLLINDFVDKFLLELSCVCIPELYLNYHLGKMFTNIDNLLDMKNAIEELKIDFQLKKETSKQFKSVEAPLKNIENFVQRNNNLQEIKKYIIQIRSENNELIRSKKLFTQLKECSPWLANFQASDWPFELEIPGQYSGNCKPLLRYHAKVSSFQPNISVFGNSLRKPIQIVIFGNDSKDYTFMLKFGEDLRQDQRIQQLFSLANNILQRDTQCQQRDLTLEKYEVIPLTTCMGLIQWVGDSKKLQDFIFDETSKNECLKIQTDYWNWIKAASGNEVTDMAKYYSKAVISYTREETIRNYTKCVHSVPADILSKSFWNISMDVESYTSLRQQFITSYATMCLIHWLFGIGDRNLGNCLIQKSSGRSVGIDFGYAFGTATQNLQIPELIPFRLTPHIINLMGPLGITGFIENTMIHCLRALRKQKHILLSTMNVFIMEPSVDWLDFARNQEKNFGSFSQNDWFPNQKIRQARKKFDGANPVAITKEELKNGVLNNNSDVLNAYLNVADGNKQHNIRSRMPDDKLTEEEQVKCLIDQATDYNILGRMYAGLELWI